MADAGRVSVELARRDRRAVLAHEPQLERLAARCGIHARGLDHRLPERLDQCAVAVPPPSTSAVTDCASSADLISSSAATDGRRMQAVADRDGHRAEGDQQDEGCREREQSSGPRAPGDGLHRLRVERGLDRAVRPPRESGSRRSARTRRWPPEARRARTRGGSTSATPSARAATVAASALGDRRPLRMLDQRDLESLGVLGRQRVERVAGGQLGELLHVHDVTPISVRRRDSPSRILVFTVPSGAPTSAAISLWLYPPKYASEIASRWTSGRAADGSRDPAALDAQLHLLGDTVVWDVEVASADARCPDRCSTAPTARGRRLVDGRSSAPTFFPAPCSERTGQRIATPRGRPPAALPRSALGRRGRGG